MGQSARVKSIETLELFQGALKRYRADALESMDAANIAAQRTIARLHEKENYWRSRLIVHTERGPVIDKAAEAELQKTLAKIAAVESAYNTYMKQASQLRNILENELARGSLLIGKSVNTLKGYLAQRERGIDTDHRVKSPQTIAIVSGIASNLSEKLAMAEVEADPTIGTEIMRGKIKDLSYSPENGWVKMQYVHETSSHQPELHDPPIQSNRIVLHYFHKIESHSVKQLKVKE